MEISPASEAGEAVRPGRERRTKNNYRQLYRKLQEQ
jgi:hypothetical protein